MMPFTGVVNRTHCCLHVTQVAFFLPMSRAPRCYSYALPSIYVIINCFFQAYPQDCLWARFYSLSSPSTLCTAHRSFVFSYCRMIIPPIPETSDLSVEIQNRILKNSRLLHGILLDQDGPRASNEEVALFKDAAARVPLYAPESTSAEIKVFSTLSEPDIPYIQMGWGKKALSNRQSYDLITSTDQLTPISDPHDTLHLLGRFQVPCITVQVDPQDLSPSRKFVQAITGIFIQPNEAAKLQELRSVLSKFGPLLATRVEMGLSLCTTKTVLFRSREAQLAEEEEIKMQLLGFLHGAVQGSDTTNNRINVYIRVQ